MSARTSTHEHEGERRSRPSDDATIARTLATLERGPLAAFLHTRRWYGAKGREIARTRVVDFARLRAPAAHAALVFAIVEVEYAGDDRRDRFGVPLAMGSAGDATPDEVIRSVDIDGRSVPVADATSDEHALRGILAAIARSETHATARGGLLVGEARVPFAHVLGGAAIEEVPARPMRAEQSNTSIVYGGPGPRAVVKVLRKLEDGESLEVEIGRHLGRVGFTGTPAFLGDLRWLPPRGEGAPVTLAVAQAFVESATDGFRHALADLRARRAGEARALDEFLAEIRALAALTAAMHVALATDDGAHDGAFRLERLDADGRARFVSPALLLLDEVTGWVSTHALALAPEVRHGAHRVLAAIPALARTLRDPSTLPEGLPLARVHGDYHLGQVLRAHGGAGWTIVDFEGEPQRSLVARRQKSSPLRDVATMLRSFDYAAVASIRDEDGAPPSDDARAAARAWHDHVRAAYLDTYFAVASRASPPIVPRDPAVRARALRFFEIEKALRELLYEIDHRPTWIDIPLSALARMSGEP